MKLHSRTIPVQAATAELKLTLLDFQEGHDLTDVEMLGALQEIESNITRRLLRAERHPDNPGRKADEA